MRDLSDLGQAALEWVERGWPVNPLVPGDKQPITRKGVRDASRDPEQIKRWWLDNPAANIGGALEEKVCIDVDPKSGGHLTWARLVEQYGEPVTEHHLGGQYQTSEGVVRSHHYIFSSQGVDTARLKMDGLGQGIDVLWGPGKYIVLPPSRHPSRVEYEWLKESGHPTPLPVWVVNLASKLPDRQRSAGGEDRLAGFLQNLPLDDHNRDTALSQIAGNLAKRIESFDDFSALLRSINSTLNYPKDQRDVDRIAVSIWETENRGRQARIHRFADDLEERQLAGEEVKAKRAGEAIKIPSPQFGSLADLETADLPDPKWAVDQLAEVDHNVMLTAQFKTGKTTMLINLAKALADQEPFLGTFDVCELTGRIGVWNLEMGVVQFRKWLLDVGIQNKDAIVPWNLKGGRLPLINEAGQMEMLLWLTTHEIKYLLIDPWASLLRQSGLSENSNDDAGMLTDALDLVMSQHPLDLLVISSHTGRAKVEEGEEHGRGATRQDDWPDSRWVMTRDKHKNRYFAVEGRDTLLAEGRVEIDESRRLTLVQGESRATVREETQEKDADAVWQTQVTTAERAILDRLRTDPAPLSTGESRALLPVRDKEKPRLMTAIESRGVVRRVVGKAKGQNAMVWQTVAGDTPML